MTEQISEIRTINFTTKTEHGKTIIEARPTPIFYEQDGRRHLTEGLLAKETELRDLEMRAEAEGLLLSAKDKDELNLLDKIQQGYEKHLTAKIMLDGELDNLTIRNRNEAIKQAEEKAGVKYPYHFVWLDGASKATGTIEFPWDGYSKVYAVKGSYDNPVIIFLDEFLTEAKPGERTPKKPYFERTGGKTIVYMEGFSGAGTEQSPFEVATPADLEKFASGDDGWDDDAYYLQTEDIDLSEHENWAQISSFNGVYDGGFHKISNISQTISARGGFFYAIGFDGIIANLVLDNPCMTLTTSIAALRQASVLAFENNGLIENCSLVSAQILNATSGSLFARANNGTIRWSRVVNVSVSMTENMGGVAGLVQDNKGTITDCYCADALMEHESTWPQVSGLVGQSSANAIISNCFSSVIIEPMNNSSGLVGTNSGTVESSFYDADVSGHDDTGKGEPLTTAEMQDIDTYLDAGWNICEKADFDPDNPTTWWIDDGNDYPRLWYEWIPPAPPIIDVTNVTRYTISAILGFDVSTATFTADQDLTEFVARIGGYDHATGPLAFSGGALSEGDNGFAVVEHGDLVNLGDGEHRINVYGKNAAGLWTEYMNNGGGDGS